MPLVNKLEITEKNLAVHGPGTRRHFRVLWGWQSALTETTEKLRALGVGGLTRHGERGEFTKQAAWGRVEPLWKGQQEAPPKKMLKMKSAPQSLLKTKGQKKCS